MKIKKIPVKLKMTPRVREYNRALKKGEQVRHVFKNSKGWAVKRVGAGRAAVVRPYQEEAIKIAKSQARRVGSRVVIHRRDGRIREVI